MRRRRQKLQRDFQADWGRHGNCFYPNLGKVEPNFLLKERAKVPNSIIPVRKISVSKHCRNRNGSDQNAIWSDPFTGNSDLLEETLIKSFNKLRMSDNLLIPFVVSLSNHERNQTNQRFPKTASGCVKPKLLRFRLQRGR
jgi:hypothetical protein